MAKAAFPAQQILGSCGCYVPTYSSVGETPGLMGISGRTGDCCAPQRSHPFISVLVTNMDTLVDHLREQKS